MTTRMTVQVVDLTNEARGMRLPEKVSIHAGWEKGRARWGGEGVVGCGLQSEGRVCAEGL